MYWPPTPPFPWFASAMSVLSPMIADTKKQSLNSLTSPLSLSLKVDEDLTVTTKKKKKENVTRDLRPERTFKPQSNEKRIERERDFSFVNLFFVFFYFSQFGVNARKDSGKRAREVIDERVFFILIFN